MSAQSAMVTVTRTVTVAAGVFAPGHLGELTQFVPFELVDDVLERPGFRGDSVSPACRSCVPVGRSRPTLVIRCRSGAGCQGAALSPSGYRIRVIFAPPSDYRTPVHVVPWRPLGGATVVTDAPRPGPGQAWACPLFLPLGPPEAQRQGRAWRVHVPGSLTVRGCPAVTAGLDAEGRSRTLARRVPQPGRGSLPGSERRRSRLILDHGVWPCCQFRSYSAGGM